MPKKARQSFAKSDPEDESVHIVVSEDDVYDDDHPYVKAWPEMFGDFRQFQIVDRVGVSTEFIPNVFDQASGRPSGTRAWLMHWRFGSGVRDANAFRVLLL